MTLRTVDFNPALHAQGQAKTGGVDGHLSTASSFLAL